jgi:hypothetical protein
MTLLARNSFRRWMMYTCTPSGGMQSEHSDSL